MFSVKMANKNYIEIAKNELVMYVWVLEERHGCSHKYELRVGSDVLYHLYPYEEPFRIQDGKEFPIHTTEKLLESVQWWMSKLEPDSANDVVSAVKRLLE